MQTVTRVTELRARVRAWRAAGDTVGFVPTMGNLHGGHMSLITLCQQRAQRSVASIYVNPLQFGLNEDFHQYPRTLEADSKLLEEAGVDLLFAPATEEVYPLGEASVTRVEVPLLSDILCGEFRPGHFAGVATVVAKLLNMVQPDVAIFGEKDFQQLTIIRRMVEDLCLPVDIVGAPTGREPDGLAMSSRNRYLTDEERSLAPAIHRLLEKTRQRVVDGADDFAALREEGMAELARLGFSPDYFEVRRAVDLGEPLPESDALVALTAARLGKARLIDNVRINRKRSPAP